MARKARKASTVKAKKAGRAKASRKVQTKRKLRTAIAKKTARRPRKARKQGIADKVTSAFDTLVDSIQETRALRNKMSPPGSEP